MNVIFKMLLSGLVKYLEEHPEQVVELIGEGVQAAIDALKKARLAPQV